MPAMLGRMRPLVVLFCVWVFMHKTYVQSFSAKLQPKLSGTSITSLYAKKSKSSSKSSVSEKSPSKGFGNKDTPTIPMKPISREPLTQKMLEDQDIGYVQNTNNLPPENKDKVRKTKEMDPAEMDRLFQKYGLGEKRNTRTNKSKKELQQKKERGELSFGEEVLARIPEDFQTKIDNGLIVATFLALSFVVLCGIGEYTKSHSKHYEANMSCLSLSSRFKTFHRNIPGCL